VKLADSHAKRPPARAVTPDAEPPIVQTARDQLRRSLYPGLRRVDCTFAHGRLRLSGRLQSYFEKQLAQETVARISGVTEVVNDIDVHYAH
jgi:osmotically-inducible protein OsmY